LKAAARGCTHGRGGGFGERVCGFPRSLQRGAMGRKTCSEEDPGQDVGLHGAKNDDLMGEEVLDEKKYCKLIWWRV